MKTMTSRYCSRIVTFVSILLAVVLVTTGCTPKVVPVEGPQISMMVETNFTSSEYDAGALLLWNIGQSTLQTSGTSVVHVTDSDNGGLPLYWQPGSPVRVVQQWNYLSKKALITTISKDANLLTPPEGMQYLLTKDSAPIQRWYASDENAFVNVPEQPGLSNETPGTKTITITEQGVAPASKAQTLTVPVPSGLTQIDVVYGSGSITNGFVLVETRDKVAKNAADSLWLLRMNNGAGSWARCGDLSAFDGEIIAGQDPSFARVGSLLYFTHSHTRIGCIDTAATSPSVTLPENINTLLAKLYSNGPTNTEGPLQAQLASDNGVLIIEYPAANWNGGYDYAVDTSGTILGSLYGNKISIVSFDAKGKQGSSIPTPGSTSFPSIDLFQ
ncbi:hypothetical protein [Candidatus Cryosericum septentrionale]|jgi:hypothetical protein|uniref:Uncharacterized protein n=1 Tax=Candidatus Cryosericum septentrionale TaxID=2290913 RepID=A0A398DP80_9BACT|nr:hypothetical protein [Candidatus Cryosericum septentrionale]RIE17015.1 hypothetical protein SMC1_03415 [Candidatus Cryosericum septentrionale]